MILPFTRRRSNRRLELWEAPNGRWYWHLKVSGRVKDHGDYASRRSARRALRAMYPDDEIRVLGRLGRAVR